MGHPPNHQSGSNVRSLILIYSYKLCALSKSFVCLKIRAKYLNIQNSTEAWWSSKTKYMIKDIRDPNLIIPFNKHEHEMPGLANGIILNIKLMKHDETWYKSGLNTVLDHVLIKFISVGRRWDFLIHNTIASLRCCIMLKLLSPFSIG